MKKSLPDWQAFLRIKRIPVLDILRNESMLKSASFFAFKYKVLSVSLE